VDTKPQHPFRAIGAENSISNSSRSKTKALFWSLAEVALAMIVIQL
jgi:hypothetical protein